MNELVQDGHLHLNPTAAAAAALVEEYFLERWQHQPY
jgi:hypothetical protein